MTENVRNVQQGLPMIKSIRNVLFHAKIMKYTTQLHSNVTVPQGSTESLVYAGNVRLGIVTML